MSRRILITAPGYPPQRHGISHVVEAHATGFAGLGHDVTVATGFDPNRDVQSLLPVHVEQFQVTGCGKLLSSGYRGELERYKQFILDFRGDVIYCHCWQIWSTDLAVIAFANNHCKKILVSHGYNAANWRQAGNSSISLRSIAHRLTWQSYVARVPAMLRAFDHVVFLSDRKHHDDFYDRQVIDRIKAPPSFSIIPNGAYIDRFAQREQQRISFRTKMKLTASKIVLYVANYNPLKNQALALDVFLKVNPPDTALILIGSEMNDYALRLRASYEAVSGPKPPVLFFEKLATQEISAAYCAADLFLCSSNWELQPLVIIDAMAAGVAWLSTDVGCVRTLPGGLVVGNPAELRQQLSRLLKDDAARSQLALEGLSTGRTAYSWASVIKWHDVLMDRLLAPDAAQEVMHEVQ